MTARGHFIALVLLCTVALCQGCFGCAPTGGFLHPVRAVQDSTGAIHAVAPYLAHTGYSPAFQDVRYARLDGEEALVVDTDIALGEEVARHGLMLDELERPAALVQGRDSISVVRFSPEGWELLADTSMDPFQVSMVTPWMDAGGTIHVTMLETDRVLTRRLSEMGLPDAEITDLPEGYSLTRLFVSDMGWDPVWLLQQNATDQRILVPASLDCSTTGCAWVLDEEGTLTSDDGDHRRSMAGRAADGTVVVVDALVVADPSGEGWMDLLYVRWPGGEYGVSGVGFGQEQLAVAPRPDEGLVVATHQRYDESPIHLLVMDGAFEATQVELAVDRGIQNGLDLLTETTADGELVHVITTDEQIVVIYTVNLDTGEQTTRTWEAKPA